MTPDDVAPTALLLEEMQAHYGVACPPRAVIAARLRALPDGVSLLVATDDPDVIGFAAICTLFPGPGLAAGLFLKDLFVAARARGRGAGGALLRAAARVAVERGFARIDWTAERGNGRLRAFYAAKGAVEQAEKVFFRLSGPMLAALATGD